MSYVVVSDSMLDKHAEHSEVRPACPLCKRYGPAPAPEGAQPGKLLAVNPPQSVNPSEW